MRIAIDVQPLQTGTRFGGVGCYLRNVLQRICRLDGDNEYTFLLNNSDYLANVNAPSSHWKKHYLTRKYRLGRWWWCWDTVYLPMVFVQKSIDLYHYNSLSEIEKMAPPVPFGKHRVVATIHDLIPLKFPEQSQAYFALSRWNFDYTAKLRRLEHADAIITVSEYSKKDIIQFLNYPEEKVFVAYNGVSEIFRQKPMQNQLDEFTQKYHLPDNFILYLGGYYSKRKNIERLLRAYKILRQHLPHPQLKLVLAGLSNPTHQKQIFSMIHELQLTSNVIPLPYIPGEELPYLYRAATLFVYPSLYEGFGLPAAEALACGTVTAVSNVSSLPEIVGDAGLYFDPYDVHSIAEIMHEGLTNTEKRGELQRHGPQQAAQFSWQQTAKRILSVYNQVYTSKK